jgi:hypothetical protein
MTIKTSINTSIKMCFWNTGGLKSKSNDKTSDPIFLKEIEKYDLVFIVNRGGVEIKKKQKQKLLKEIPSVPLNNCSIIIINSFQ